MNKSHILIAGIFIVCLSNLVSSDVLSINNGGSGEFVLIPQEQINNLFTGNPTPAPAVPEVKKNGFALKIIEQGKTYKYQYLLLLIGLVIGLVYSHYRKKKKKFFIAGKDDDEEEKKEDMEVKSEKV